MIGKKEKTSLKMDISLLQTLSLLLCFLLSLFLLLATAKKQSNSSTGARLPPGPPRLPVFGNIFHVGNNLHCSLTDFSRIYGPIMSLKLGSLTTVIISSPEAAKEALKTHDHALSARIFNDPVRVFDHYKNSVVWLPSSTRWRFLRRITMTHLISAQRLDANQSLQMRKTQELHRFISKCCKRGEAIDMAHASFVTVLNIISSAMFSIDLATYDSRSSHEFQDTVIRLTKAVGKPNVGDFFPFLRFLDLQGTRKEAALCVGRMFRVFQNIIDVRIAKRSSQKEHREDDMLDTLLDLTQENEEGFTINDIKHLLIDLFFAATDTSSSTIEWAMSELLCNPEKMVKAQTEIMQVIGENGVIQESDISKFPYLQAIVKETLRLHPPLPIIPRKLEDDVQFFGFHLPKNASVLVNVWAIGRDSNVWENPMRFAPERFLLREIDVKGKDFELIPFGSGRRMCPGISMALKIVSLVLSSLLYSFEWKLQNGVVPGDMDMSEAFGITLHKAKPLCAVPIKKPTTV